MAALDAAGFETFEPASGNHREQVETFRNADVVVAVHGAALTNLMFCRPGTLVVELFAEDHVKSTYLWLAHRLGLRHVAVVGTPGDLNQGFPLFLRARETETTTFSFPEVYREDRDPLIMLLEGVLTYVNPSTDLDRDHHKSYIDNVSLQYMNCILIAFLKD